MDTNRQYTYTSWGMITVSAIAMALFGGGSVAFFTFLDGPIVGATFILGCFVALRNLATRPFRVELLEESGSVRGTYRTLFGNTKLAYFESGAGSFTVAQQYKRGKGLFFIRPDERAQAVLPQNSTAAQSWLEANGHVIQSLEGTYLAAELNNTDLPFERKLVKPY